MQSRRKKVKSRKDISYLSLFLFFLPLAVTPTIIGLSHSIVDAALARMPSPELSIAIFAIVKGFSNIVKSPIYTSRQVVSSMVDSKESYYLAIKFLGALCGFFLFILISIGYTPLGNFVFRNIYGLREIEQLEFARAALRITAFMPLVEYLRNTHQGIVISLKKTHLFLPGIILRLVFISSFLYWTVQTQAVLGVVAGSITWFFGIGLEAVFIIASLFFFYKSPAQAAELMPVTNKKELEVKSLFKFFLPLGLMMSFASFVQPIIQAGLGRTESPTEALAVFGVSMGLMFVLSGSLSMLHNVSLVHAEDHNDENWPKIFKFCLSAGLIVSSIIFIISVTPIGFWIFNSVISVSVGITEIAMRVMLVLSVVPLFRAIREAYWGLLMTEKNTRAIGISKLMNIIMVIITLIISILFINIHPAIIGGLAYTLGEGAETFAIWFQAITDWKEDKREFAYEN